MSGFSPYNGTTPDYSGYGGVRPEDIDAGANASLFEGAGTDIVNGVYRAALLATAGLGLAAAGGTGNIIDAIRGDTEATDWIFGNIVQPALREQGRIDKDVAATGRAAQMLYGLASGGTELLLGGPELAALGEGINSGRGTKGGGRARLCL